MTQRPEAFENLITKVGSLKEADRDEEEIEQYIAVAKDMLRDSLKAENSAHGRYMLAYDGLHNQSIAVLLHYGTRPADAKGHRSVAFHKFCDVLSLDAGRRKIVITAHERRNETTYRSALPPLTHKDAENVIAILSETLPKTIALIFGEPDKPSGTAKTPKL